MEKKNIVWYTLGEAAKATGIARTRLDHACRVGRVPYRRSETGARLLSHEVIEKLRKDGLRSFPRPYDPAGISTADDRQSSSPPPSSVLQARRERIEELNLEGQELRARRELERQRAEQADEAERRAVEGRVRGLEREERREQDRAERLQQDRLQQESEADQRRQALRQQVQLALHATLPANVSYDQQKAFADQLDTELQRACVETADAALPILRSVVSRFFESLRFQERERRRTKTAEEARLRALDSALWRLRINTPGSTEADQAEAAKAVREAFAGLAADATESEIRCCAEAAIAPIREKIERRVRRNQLIESGVKEIGPYLERLHRAGGLPKETLADYGFRRTLEDSVRSRLQRELTTESPVELRRLVQEIVDSELNGLD